MERNLIITKNGTKYYITDRGNKCKVYERVEQRKKRECKHKTNEEKRLYEKLSCVKSGLKNIDWFKLSKEDREDMISYLLNIQCKLHNINTQYNG